MLRAKNLICQIRGIQRGGVLKFLASGLTLGTLISMFFSCQTVTCFVTVVSFVGYWFLQLWLERFRRDNHLKYPPVIKHGNGQSPIYIWFPIIKHVVRNFNVRPYSSLWHNRDNSVFLGSCESKQGQGGKLGLDGMWKIPWIQLSFWGNNITWSSWGIKTRHPLWPIFWTG